MNDGMKVNDAAKADEIGLGKKRHSYTSRLIQSWKKTSGWNKAIVLLTAVIAGANVLYTVYARRQWQVANQTLTEIRNGSADTHALAVAATSAAQTAKDTLDSSGRSFKQEQRPYLWASSFNLSDPPICAIPGQHRVCADVHVTNSGRTPATGVHIHRYATFGPNAERTVRAMRVPVYETPSGDMLGSVGDKWGTAATDPVDEKTAADLISGKLSLYVYGVVQYFDVFGDYHETGFCNFKLPNGPFMTCEFANWFDKKTDKIRTKAK